MAQIILHGDLGERFGSRHEINVRSPAEAIRALDANFRGFRGHLLKEAQDNVSYKIIVGDEELTDAAHIAYPSGRQTISFVPLIAGSGGKGFSIGEIIIGAALVAASWWAGGSAGIAYFGAEAAGTISSVGMAVGMSMALGGIYQLLAPHPKTPNAGTASSYIFNGAVNTTAQGAPVPVGYGRMIVGSVIVSGGISSDPIPASLTPMSGVTEILVPTPDLTVTDPTVGNFNGWVSGGGGSGGGKGGASGGATEDPNTLQSHAYASFVDLICEGEIGGLVNGAQSIYVNGTPLQNPNGSFNFAGLAIYFANGAQSQSVIPEIGNRIQSETIVGAQVYYAVPVIKTITDQTVTGARVTIEVPQLTYQDPSNGDIHGSSVGIAIDVQTQGSGFLNVVTDTISGKCTSPYERDYVFTLTGSPPWDIRVRRTSPDPTDVDTQNLVFFQAYSEIIDTNLSYANSAISGMMIDSAQFSSVPVRSYDVKLLKVKIPANYNPTTRAYSGIWDGSWAIAWTDNPAWAFYDLLTNTRYGLGQYVTPDQVDKWSLYQIAQYCDELIPDGFGGTRPRFTCNIYFQQQADAFKVIQDLASIFRGVAFWSNQTITARQDAPADPVYLFSPSNVSDGLFTYAGASAKARHTVVYVTWNDPLQQYQQKVEYVEDQNAVKKFGVVPVSVVALGCTNRGQAHNVGEWILYVEQNESETVTFKTGVEGSGIMPGSVILVSDPTRAGERLAGRVNAATINTVTIDDDFNPVGGSLMAAILPDGTFQEVSIVSKSGRTFTVTPNWNIAPNPQAQWAISQPNLVPQQFRIISISDSVAKDGNYTITAIAHNPNKYAAIEDGALLEALPIIDFTSAPPPVTNETLTEQLYVTAGQLKSLVLISWTAQGNTTSYLVSYKKDGGNFYDMPAQNSPSIDIRNLDPGVYVFKIVAKDVLGHLSAPVIIDYTVLGDQTPPANVKGFQIVEEAGDLLLTWSPNADVDLGGYEIRQGDSWDTGTLIVTQYGGTTFKVRPTVAGIYYYHIRAISTGGVYSAAVSDASITLVAPAPVDQFNVIQSNNTIQFLWLQNPELDITGYEIREGDTWSASVLVVQLLATHFSLPLNNAATRTFWIKAIRAPGIYSDVAVFSTNTLTPVPNMNELVTSDQEALGWPGQKIYCSVVSTELVQDNNTARAEYIFDVSLGADFNCINTVGLTLGSVTYDTVTWASATFAWNSSTAGRQWIPSGDINSVSARVQIGRQTGLQTNEVDGWDCASTVSTLGTAATTSSYVTYQAGRYNNGIYVGDLTKVDWAVTVPAEFSCVFWYQPAAINDSVLWSVTDGTHSLRVGYSVSRNLFYLEDQTGNQVTVAFPFAVGDYLIIGVSQDLANRALYIGNLTGTVASASESIVPIGTFNKIQLHG